MNTFQNKIHYMQEDKIMLEVIAVVSLAVVGINSLCDFLGLLGESEEKDGKEIYVEKNYYR